MTPLDFLEFRDYLAGKLGVTIPICPGILPVLSASQIQRFTSMCGARIPAGLRSSLEPLALDDAAAVEFGIEYASKQCADLFAAGVPGIHFYTLNKAYSTGRILKNLGLG